MTCICGPREQVVHAVESLVAETQKIGLSCNPEKCWATKELEAAGIKFNLKDKEVPTVLGAPLNPGEVLPTSIIPKPLMTKVGELPDMQVALHLLRYIHNSKFTQLFRLSSAEASQPLAKVMMKETRRVSAMMLECDDIPDSSWAQALLPMGPGLGFVDLVRMAPFMAHASILETVLRLAEMDPFQFQKL